MARIQIRTETISPSTIMDVTDKFPNLRSFKEIGGITISDADLYIVMRGEPHTQEVVQEVEQGYLRAIEVMNMDADQLLKVIHKRINDLAEDKSKALDALRELAGNLLYIK